jgi:hypothetical protein
VYLNIARAVALVEDCCCLRYAANAIEAPLASGHRAVRRFQEIGQYTKRPGSGRKRATTHRDDRFLNNKVFFSAGECILSANAFR